MLLQDSCVSLVAFFVRLRSYIAVHPSGREGSFRRARKTQKSAFFCAEGSIPKMVRVGSISGVWECLGRISGVWGFSCVFSSFCDLEVVKVLKVLNVLVLKALKVLKVFLRLGSC